MNRAKNFKDLTGMKFGRLTVRCIDEDKTFPKHIYWKCDCECGGETSVARGQLTSGRTQSCGCLQREFAVENGKKTKEFNGCEFIDDHYEIKLRNGKRVLFDVDDYGIISKYSWHYKAGYAYAMVNNEDVPMHFVLFGEKLYDHKNHNKLDNRRSNLRKCTYSENNQNRLISTRNTSGVIGVGLDSRGRWTSRVTVDGKRKTVYAGWSFEDAVIARLKAEKEYYGEFAPQKHLYEQYNI